MPIPVKCGACSATYNLPDDLSGRQVRCRKCQTIVRVPGTKYLREFRVTTEENLKASSIVVISQADTVPIQQVEKPKPVQKKGTSKSSPASKPSFDDDINFDDLDFGNRGENYDTSHSSDDHACRNCGEPLSKRAKECEFCGEVFDDGLKKKREKAKKAKARKQKQRVARGSCPAGIILICVLMFLFAAIFLFAGLMMPARLPGMIIAAVAIAMTAMGVGLLRGDAWAWWLAVSNYTLALVSYPLTLIRLSMMGIPLDQGLVTRPLVGVGISALIVFYFRSDIVREYFQIEEAGFLKSTLILIAVWLIEIAIIMIPVLLISAKA